MSNGAITQEHLIKVLIFFDYIPRRGIAEIYGSSIFSFSGASILFSFIGLPIYIPTNRVQGFPFSVSSPALVINYFTFSEMKVAQLCLPLCDPMDYTVHEILQTRILERVAVIPFSRGSSQPSDRARYPSLQVNSLPAEPPGKPKNTGVGTQESNQGLLHCR